MNTSLIIIFLIAASARICSAIISKRNERRLLAAGATEHGALNSKLLTGAHILYYLAAFGEGLYKGTVFDDLSLAGLVILICAFAMLTWVISLLWPIWTLKIMIADRHPISRHALFRYVRHPNYFLSVLPELIGYTLIFHAWWTAGIGMPIYLVILAVRIHQEERAMKGLFSGAASG